MYDPLGLSIGTTNLVAAGNGGPPVTRRAVLTLYPHCAPKIGVPSQNPNLIEPGALMSGFVERIGDAVALVSPDGSVHDPDLLLVEALDAMVLTAGADASSSEIAIAVPAHWKPELYTHCVTVCGRTSASSAAAWRRAWFPMRSRR